MEAAFDQPSSFKLGFGNMRYMWRPAFFWGTLGAFAASAWTLSLQMHLIASHGYAYWLGRNFLSSFSCAFILILAWAVAVRSGTDLAAKPGRFLLILAIGAVLATWVNWGLELIMPLGSNWPKWQRLLEGWINITLFGAVFGWAGVLNIRRIEDQARLDKLLSRRSVLALQVAHSNLLATRAKIDPEMVVRILKDVRTRYQSDTGDASALLDQMIGYLRMAMGREREKKFSLTSELALVRAYVGLRETEMKQPIGIHVNVQGGGALAEKRVMPIFAIAKKLLDQALPEQPEKLGLLIDVQAGAMKVGIEIGSVPLSEIALERIQADLHALPNGGPGLEIRHKLLDTGNHRYVVKISG